jgi:two-component system LytT family response regulator
MYSILIADPDYSTRMMLRESLSLVPGIKTIIETDCWRETTLAMVDKVPDVIFLDFNLYACNHFQIRKDRHNSPQIIITSFDRLHAHNAYDLEAVDFLYKPFKKERLDRTVRKLMDIYVSNEKDSVPQHPYLFVPCANGFSRIDSTQIRYIKAARDYTVLYTENREWISSIGIGKIVQKLDPFLFIRVHRSCIVNLSKIERVVRTGSCTSLFLEDGPEIIVGRSYLPIIKPLLL